MNFIDSLLVFLGGRKVLSTMEKHEAAVQQEMYDLSARNEEQYGQIGELEDRISELEDQIEELEDKVSDLEDQVFDLESENLDLELEKDEVQQQLDDLEEALIARGMDPDELRLLGIPDEMRNYKGTVDDDDVIAI